MALTTALAATICLLSGLVIVTSILDQPSLGALRGAELTAGAFREAMPTFGPVVLTLGLLTFVFSTILSDLANGLMAYPI